MITGLSFQLYTLAYISWFPRMPRNIYKGCKNFLMFSCHWTWAPAFWMSLRFSLLGSPKNRIKKLHNFTQKGRRKGLFIYYFNGFLLVSVIKWINLSFVFFLEFLKFFGSVEETHLDSEAVFIMGSLTVNYAATNPLHWRNSTFMS